jgi:hypothetical protein
LIRHASRCVALRRDAKRRHAPRGCALSWVAMRGEAWRRNAPRGRDSPCAAWLRVALRGTALQRIRAAKSCLASLSWRWLPQPTRDSGVQCSGTPNLRNSCAIGWVHLVGGRLRQSRRDCVAVRCLRVALRGIAPRCQAMRSSRCRGALQCFAPLGAARHGVARRCFARRGVAALRTAWTRVALRRVACGEAHGKIISASRRG